MSQLLPSIVAEFPVIGQVVVFPHDFWRPDLERASSTNGHCCVANRIATSNPISRENSIEQSKFVLKSCGC